jgi:hypothetical protein
MFNIEKIWKFLKKHSTELPFICKFEQYGDEYCHGELCKIHMDDKIFEICYNYETEARLDWAQAESIGPS